MRKSYFLKKYYTHSEVYSNPYLKRNGQFRSLLFSLKHSQEFSLTSILNNLKHCRFIFFYVPSPTSNQFSFTLSVLQINQMPIYLLLPYFLPPFISSLLVTNQLVQASTCTFHVYLIVLVCSKECYLKFVKYPSDKEECY